MASVVALTTASLAWFLVLPSSEVSAFQVDIRAGKSMGIKLAPLGASQNELSKHTFLMANNVAAAKGEEKVAYFPASVPDMPEGYQHRLNASTPVYDADDPEKLAVTDGRLGFKRIGAKYEEQSTAENIADAGHAGNDFILLRFSLNSNTAMAVYLDEPAETFSTEETNPNLQITRALRLAVVWRKMPTAENPSFGEAGYIIYNPHPIETRTLQMNQRQNGTHYNEYAYESGTEPIYLFDLAAPANGVFDEYEVNVYIFIEGFDPDCNIFTSDTTFATRLKFSGQEI